MCYTGRCQYELLNGECSLDTLRWAVQCPAHRVVTFCAELECPGDLCPCIVLATHIASVEVAGASTPAAPVSADPVDELPFCPPPGNLTLPTVTLLRH